MSKVLEKVFPIMDVEHDCIISKMGDITLAYALILPEIFTLSETEYESIHQSWMDLKEERWYSAPGSKLNYSATALRLENH